METIDRLSAALADRYRIERELGQGGMATVYLAHDLKHDRQVAIKVLKPELAAVLGAERFVVEIKTTAALQHPHILPLFDSGTADGFLYYVMPFIQGETLRAKLDRETQFSIEEAVRIAVNVADALDYAHRHGVIHRDIKPENILLHDGRPMVADFGIALALSAAAGGRMTETGLSLGTPHYMSPEQATAEKEITARSDVYSVGSVLYEMLTGNPPHTGASAQQIIMKIITESAAPVTQVRKSVPPNVAAAVAKSLEKLPADRFESAAAFAAALTNAGFTLPMAAGGAGAGIAGTRWKERAAMPLAIGAVVLFAAAIWGWTRPSPAPLVTRQRTILWSHPVSAGNVGLSVAIAPDGNAIAYVDNVGGTRQLWVKDRDRIEATALAGTIGAFGPVFSPDGQSIAFVADGKVKRVPRLGGSAITVADSANVVLPAVAWVDDGTILFNNRRYDLLAINVDGGPQRLVHSADSARGVVSVTPLPGGRGALFGTCLAGCPASDLRAFDLRTGAVRILTDEALKAWYLSSGIVVFVRRDGGVFSVPFDLGGLKFGAAPVPVLDGVRTSVATADMAVSPTGTLLYVAGTSQLTAEPVEAVWVTREGVATPIDSSWRFVPPGNSGLSLSPDGRRLAVGVGGAGSADIWIKELDRGPYGRLTFEGTNEIPTWTADGRSVMYGSQALGRNRDIHTRRADGTGSEATLLDAARPLFQVLRTPDTTQFIVRFASPPSREIHLLTRGTDSARTSQLVAIEGFDAVSPALSPDGRWLAYAANESGRWEVYVRPFPNANTGRWQVSRDGGTEPGWAHSGRELFYRDGSGAMISSTVVPGQAFVLGAQRTLFSAAALLRSNVFRNWDVSPDDRRFVFTRRVGGQVAQSQLPVTVIQVDHWLTELKAKVKR